MKKIFMLLLTLTIVFFVEWGIKAKTPMNRPDSVEEDYEEVWYNKNATSSIVDSEWVLDEEIPDCYVPVVGEKDIYMYIGDDGSIICYVKKVTEEDGTLSFEEVNIDIPEDYEAVDGLEDVYKYTDENGDTKYVKYVRNDDDTFAFVEVDKNGTPLDVGTDATNVDSDTYQKVSDDTYVVLDENNVLTGYRKRVANEDETGYIWEEADAPTTSTASSGDMSSLFANSGSDSSDSSSSSSSGSSGITVTEGEPTTKTTQNSDGTYTEVTTSTYVQQENGKDVTYQKITTITYDSSGRPISQKTEGPYKVSESSSSSGTADASEDKSKVCNTLDKELSRVSGSVSFDTDTAKQILTKLNAQRSSSGVATLSMSKSSDAYKLACIKAADMAIYDYSSNTSPLYGSLESMIKKWGISSSNPSENVWRTTNGTAEKVHTRFQANENSRSIRMSNGYSEVGIAVVKNNGKYYIAEIYLK